MLSCINVVGGVEAKDKSAILNKKRKKKKRDKSASAVYNIAPGRYFEEITSFFLRKFEEIT